MKRESILIAMVAVLIVMNGCLLFYFLDNGRGPGEQPPPNRDKIIIEALELDRDQQEQFKQLKTEHHDRMMEINDQSNQLLEHYFSLLHDGRAEEKDTIEIRLAKLEQQRVSVTYAHFDDLKKLCHEDQKEKFDAFLPTLIEFILPRGNRRNPPPHDRRN